VFTNTNTPVHKLGQGFLQDSLQTLLFDLNDMYTPSPKIEEVVEFAKGIIVKQVLEILLSLGI
jgi:hypothetical protein